MKTRNKIRKRVSKIIKRKNKISDAKLRKFLDFKHVDELYMTLGLLGEEDVKRLIKIYRDSGKRVKKERIINRIIRHSKSKAGLLEELKKEIVLILNKEYGDLYQQISSLIRQGHDVFIEELRLMKIPLKIKIFSVTGSKRDFYAVRKIMDAIKSDLTHKKLG